jgi:Flp pilus assembly protein TadG
MATGILQRFWKPATRKNGKRGATATEMALITPMFFLLLMGITELSFIEAAQQLLENAAYNTSRLAKTGYNTNGKTQAQTVSQVLTNELQSFGSWFDTTKVMMTSVSYNTFASIGTGGTAGLGNPDQIVVYTITYPWKLLTPMIGNLIGTNGVITLVENRGAQ